MTRRARITQIVSAAAPQRLATETKLQALLGFRAGPEPQVFTIPLAANSNAPITHWACDTRHFDAETVAIFEREVSGPRFDSLQDLLDGTGLQRRTE